MNNEEIVLDVLGMSCPSCIRHVNAALAGIDGVTQVEVRLSDGKVRIQYEPGVAQLNAFIEALRDAGYESTPSRAA